MRIRLIALLIVSTLTVGCGTNRASRQSTPAKPGRILIRNYSYQPQKLILNAGSRITFVNHDHTAHTATSTNGAFDTGTLHPGQRTTVALSKPGTYTFFCQFHAFMRGVVVVR